MSTFADFDVHPDISDALADAGITTPFPIQETTLPLALSGADVIGQARTGTGKTFAFGVPLLQGLHASDGTPQGLVIVPTRELCVQVRDDLAKLGARLDISVVAVYGGRPIQPQTDALRAGAEVVVGTPGRLLDLVGRGALDLSRVSTLVLDEADEMLDLGFLPDVERLISSVPEQRQTMLFSATMPGAIVSLARRYMRKPTFLHGEVEEAGPPPETVQHFLACHRMDKAAVLARILQSPRRGRTLVFTRTKRMADVLAGELTDRGINATPIHSDLRQESREDAMSRFRSGAVDVLVATEVAARGLDISEVTHVVNYDCPEDEKMYLHRIGRTGRAGAAGVAITLGTWNELARLDTIKNALGVDSPTHEAYSTSPILDELFDLPPRGEGREPSRQTATSSSRSKGRGKARSAAGTETRSKSGAEAPSAAGTETRSKSGGKARSGTGSDEKAHADSDTKTNTGSEQGEESQRPRRRRSRRRSSDRSAADTAPAGEQPPAEDTTPTDEQPPAEDTVTAGEQPLAEDTTPTGEQPPAEDTAPAGEQPPAATAGTGATADDGGEAPVRRRVRTRSRGRGGDGHQGGDRQPSGGEQKAPRPQGGQPAARAPTQGKEKRAKRAGGGGRAGDRSGGPSASSGERRRRGARSQTPSGASRNGQPPDVAAARGRGQPALRRPMVVTHLP